MSAILRQIQLLQNDFGVTPVTAAEIEFYLHGSDQCAALPAFWEEFSAACARENIALYKIEKENGREQHEISLMPYADAQKTAEDVAAVKNILAQAAPRYNMIADFAAKPSADQPGSGLHIHIHLADASGKNMFYKNDDVICNALKFSIGGLLAWLPECMPVFAPMPESYARFAPGGNAPTTISWGANNRTVAVRLPDSEHDNKRIEHRVAGADADAALVMQVLLAAMHHGLKNRTEPGPQMYGDAGLAQYNLPKFPVTPEDAVARLRDSKTIGEYFDISSVIPA